MVIKNCMKNELNRALSFAVRFDLHASTDMNNCCMRGIIHKQHRRKSKMALSGEDSEDEDLDALIQRCGTRVYFHSSVSKESVLRLLKMLDEAADAALARADRPSDASVMLFVHSPGGDAYAGLSAMDHIASFRVPVDTCIDGYAASAATFILMAGRRRFGMPNSSLLVHQFSTSFFGKYNDLLDEAANSKALMNRFREIYCEKTKLSKGEVDKLLNTEADMSFHECVQKGLIEGPLPSITQAQSGSVTRSREGRN